MRVPRCLTRHVAHRNTPVAAEVSHPDVVAGLREDIGEAVLARGQPAGRVAHEAVLQQNRPPRPRDTVQLNTQEMISNVVIS